jgi:hypothetical protein
MGMTEAPGRPDDAFGVVLSAEPLRALDGRGRADVRASGRLRHSDAGALFYLAGEPADTLFVVARGSVRLEDETANDEPRLGRSVRPRALRSRSPRAVCRARRARWLPRQRVFSSCRSGPEEGARAGGFS